MRLIHRFTIAAVCCFAAQVQTQAQTVRCANAAGVVVAYAESSAYCPKDGATAAPIEKLSQPTPSQTAQAQRLAASDKKQGDALESVRLKQERADAKASADYSKKQASKTKKCKKADLNIGEAQAKVEDARLDGLKKGSSKVKPPAKGEKPRNTVSAIRGNEEPNSATYRKAKRKLALLEAKRELDCK